MSGAAARLDRAATLALAARATRIVAKAGPTVVRLDRRQGALHDEDLASYLVHADGFLNVPVIVKGDLLVRGYTPELYHEVFGAA